MAGGPGNMRLYVARAASVLMHFPLLFYVFNFSQNRRDDWYIFDEIQRREGMTVLNQVGRQH